MKNSIIDHIYTKTSLERLRTKNRLLGIEYNYNLDTILKVHLVIAFFLFIIVFILKNDLLLSTTLTIIYFLGAEFLFFDYRLAKRSRKLEKESSFFFQILALTLESDSSKISLVLSINTIPFFLLIF